MTEAKLPDELDEQAMLHALGVLDAGDRQAFLVRLQGESDLLRQVATAYQATTDVLAVAMPPVVPPATLRQRLVDRVAEEAVREAVQCEQAINELALSSILPIKPREMLRERLLSKLERESDVRLDVRDSEFVPAEITTPIGEGRVSRSDGRLPQGTDSLFLWLRSCSLSLSNLLGTMLVRAVAPRPSANGLTFIKASEGPWREMGPGVTAKILSFDPTAQKVTTLLRFAPNTRYAPHRHTAVEELFVLEGGCSIAGRAMTVGDYHRAEAGTEHYDTSTDEGCLLLAISSPHNEML